MSDYDDPYQKMLDRRKADQQALLTYDGYCVWVSQTQRDPVYYICKILSTELDADEHVLIKFYSQTLNRFCTTSVHWLSLLKESDSI